MPTWNSRGLRGSLLEEMINRTNEKYREQKLALIQKVPTPITPVRIDSETRQITLAYFDQKSTVDFIGTVQGVPVCFDAKECKTAAFPMQNVHEHQILFMRDFMEQGGVAFLLIHFTDADRFFYLSYSKLLEFWNRAMTGHEKHFLMSEIDEGYEIKSNGYFLHYLDALQKDLLEEGK
ncbi:MAG: Holliday junction resolvase RecU [Lachnospiraceae bacterium]|nr:Holliday junction resolvase RecU [Lachnospiraceae bacterium]